MWFGYYIDVLSDLAMLVTVKTKLGCLSVYSYDGLFSILVFHCSDPSFWDHEAKQDC